MYRRSKRNLHEATSGSKEAKRQKPLHQAQRKFASIFPSSPAKKDKVSTLGRSHKAEDFIEFLCVRHNTPTLPFELDVFMEPQYRYDEIFSEGESDDDVPLQQLVSSLGVGTRRSTSNKSDSKHTAVDTDAGSFLGVDSNVCSEKQSTNDDHVNTTLMKERVDIIDVKPMNIKLHEQKDFFKCIINIRKSRATLALVIPPENIKVAGYIVNDIDLMVETQHVHRLKHPLCVNTITSQAIIKQLEKESVTINELPRIGMCELDLPLLRDIVNSFGGVECVNRDQCWKTVADNLCIPKNASRRVKHVENIYLKYILPYETLPKEDKINLQNSVTSPDTGDTSPVEKICYKKINIALFKKMADSYKTMYCKNTSTSLTIDSQFWATVSKGERHICGTSGEVDLLIEPRDYENSKLTVCWRLQNIFSMEASALKYLGLTSKITVPVLLFEGVFSTSKWRLQEHGFSLISYLHHGDAKTWYAVPEESVKHFLSLKQEFGEFVTPNELISKGCLVTRCVQKEGQYVIVQPNCYYCTVATGYSISEVVTVAPLTSWFTSCNLLSFEPKLNEFIVTKLILMCSLEESDKETKSLYCQSLVQKLEALMNMMSTHIKRLQEAGISKQKLLVPKEASPSSCSKCSCICYLLCVKNKNLPFCFTDALKCVDSKRKSEEFVVELILGTEKIQSLITHLKFPLRKKQR